MQMELWKCGSNMQVFQSSSPKYMLSVLLDVLELRITNTTNCLNGCHYYKKPIQRKKKRIIYTSFVKWTASSEFGTYRLCEQRRFRRACASVQSRQNLRCSLIKAVNQKNLHTESQIPGLSEWLS